MKSLIIGLALSAAAAMPALAQSNVSISIGQPGFYGRIDIGDYAPPPVVYAPQPVIIERTPHYHAEPIYLRVPPGHRKHWGKHCRRYGACGRPVLFVRDEWYTNTYAPVYREHHGHRVVYREAPRPREHVRVIERVEYRDGGHGHGHGKHHDKHHGDGHGKGHGKGHGHGHGRGHD